MEGIPPNAPATSHVGLGRQREGATNENLASLITWLVIFVIVALLTVNALLILSARDHELGQVQTSSANLAHAVTQQVDASFGEIEHILSGIVYTLESNDFTEQLAARLQPILVNHVAQVEQLHSLFVFDARGHGLVHSEAGQVEADVAKHAYFIHHLTNSSERLFIGSPMMNHVTQEWTIPVSRRVNDPDGHFAGVVLAAVPVDYVRKMLSEYEVGTQGAVALNHERGFLLVRNPFALGDLGKNVSETQLHRIFSHQNRGAAEGASPLDAVLRLFRFHHAKNYPLYVTVALSKDEVLQPWRRASYFQSSWIAALCLLVAVAGTYVVRSMRRRSIAEGRLRLARDELAQANDKLSHLARYDALTGLANRRYFDERLTTIWESDANEPVSLLMADVDHFKKYNDLYGHPEGDRCLTAIALAIHSCVPSSNGFVARLGGEEFAVLLLNTEAVEAAAVAETVRAAISSLNIPHARSPTGSVTITLGAASCVPDGRISPLDLLRASDAALYRAKEAGRDRVYVAPECGSLV